MSDEIKNNNKKEGGSKYKIIYAEDDALISRAYKDGLERSGFEVTIASDGIEALKKIINKKPDLILLDLIMPNKNGFEVLEEVKKNNDLSKIPVMIFSNLGEDGDIEKSKKLGAVEHLVKSEHSMKEVVEKIKLYLVKKDDVKSNKKDN